MRNLSSENDFDLHENETACPTHFHMKGFTLRLVLKQRHKKTRKWLKKLAPILHPMRTKTNRDSLAHVFPPFPSATCLEWGWGRGGTLLILGILVINRV